MSLNQAAFDLCQQALQNASRLRIQSHAVGGATVVDAGVEVAGSLAAGLLLARVCLGDAADVSLQPEAADRFASDVGVCVRTDEPVAACLGGQYAGWPVQAGSFFAMGSGPMRMARGREEVLLQLNLRERPEQIAGVLEADRLPDTDVIQAVAGDCAVAADRMMLCVAPSTSIAGTVQVVARSVETAMHKLQACGFDVTSVRSGWGIAPLPPPAPPGDTVAGIGRTNDAILYGGRVTLWVDAPQETIDALGPRIPSGASPDHGRPFAETFKAYGYDFYKVDPQLFSPAVVTLVNLRSGTSRTFGHCALDVLQRSFGLNA